MNSGNVANIFAGGSPRAARRDPLAARADPPRFATPGNRTEGELRLPYGIRLIEHPDLCTLALAVFFSLTASSQAQPILVAAAALRQPDCSLAARANTPLNLSWQK